jgi:hypothetical protein
MPFDLLGKKKNRMTMKQGEDPHQGTGPGDSIAGGILPDPVIEGGRIRQTTAETSREDSVQGDRVNTAVPGGSSTSITERSVLSADLPCHRQQLKSILLFVQPIAAHPTTECMGSIAFPARAWSNGIVACYCLRMIMELR